MSADGTRTQRPPEHLVRATLIYYRPMAAQRVKLTNFRPDKNLLPGGSFAAWQNVASDGKQAMFSQFKAFLLSVWSPGGPCTTRLM